MNAKSSILSLTDKAKEPKLKKQLSLTSSNYDTSQRKDSASAGPVTAMEKDATNDKSQTLEEKFKQFENDGVVFRTKLIGSELVMEPRGEKMCQNSILRLKAIIKGQKAHKKRIVMKISYEGVKIYDEKTNEMLYHHEVPQISFISSDDTDSRTFGYVCDVPNKAHQFICFKTVGPAIQVMTVISSLFEAVLEKRKKEEQEGTDNHASSIDSTDKNISQQSDSMLDDQLIVEKRSITPPIEEQGSAATSDHSKPRQESATAELTKQLGHTLSFSSQIDLGAGSDSGIIESPSTAFKDWSIPPPPPHSYKQIAQQQPVSIPNRPSLSSLNSSSPITTSSTRLGMLAASNRVLHGDNSHQNRSLIYNHSSVSLNDAALSNQSSLISPTGSHNESTDRYAVFNDIDNLPSIFESTSSLGSKTNLSNVGQATGTINNTPFGASTASTANSPFDQQFSGAAPPAHVKSLQSGAQGSGGSSFDYSLTNPGNVFAPSQNKQTSFINTASDDPFQILDQQYQQQQQLQPYLKTQQQQYTDQRRPVPTPSMMVPNPATSSSFAFGPDASGGMIVGSAPMGGHQMSAHTRFSSSMVAGLHQRLGSSAASIQSVGSAGGLSRQTNPFDDDFFS